MQHALPDPHRLRPRPEAQDAANTDHYRFPCFFLAFLKHKQACICPTGKITTRNSIGYSKVLSDGWRSFCFAARHRWRIHKYMFIQLSRQRQAPFDSSASPPDTTATRDQSKSGALLILLDTRVRRRKRKIKTIVTDDASCLSSPRTTFNMTTTRRQCGSVRKAWMS